MRTFFYECLQIPVGSTSNTAHIYLIILTGNLCTSKLTKLLLQVATMKHSIVSVQQVCNPYIHSDATGIHKWMSFRTWLTNRANTDKQALMCSIQLSFIFKYTENLLSMCKKKYDKPQLRYFMNQNL